MKKLWRFFAVFILLFHMIGCSNQPSPPIQEKTDTGTLGVNPNTGGKDNGLSEEYHGHIQERPTETNIESTDPHFHNLAVQRGYVSVQLLGLNDLHGQLNVTRIVNGKKVGRVDYLATYLKQRQAENVNTLLVHAGDMIGASAPVSSLLQDNPTIEILNKLGFDIGTVGNHEFDKGINKLLSLIHGGYDKQVGTLDGASFPYGVSNVSYVKTGNLILAPYKIINVGGMPIGFVGACLSTTPSTVVPSVVAGLKFTDEAKAINGRVAELKRRGVKAIVILSHNPGTSSVDGKNPHGELVTIAKNVDDEVDIIFGGHNHAYMNAVVDNKLLVQSYSYGTAFSDVDILIDPKTRDIVRKKANIVTTYQTGINPDPEIRAMVTKYEAKVAPLVNKVIGQAAANITAKQNGDGESALGDLIADAQRSAMKTDFAFMNPGGIRADIGKGNITWGEANTVQPFNNQLVKMNLTGKQINDLLNQQWGTAGARMLQVSGMRYIWDTNRPIGDKVVQILLKDGSSINPTRAYTVTANNFLADGGDGFTVFRKGTHRVMGEVDVDALVNYIKNLPKPFNYRIDGRIRKLQY